MLVRSIYASALACLATLSGCSFVFVTAPPAQHAELHSFQCTTSRVAPVVDTVIAGLETIRTGIAIAAKESDYQDFPISRGADIGFGVGLTTLFAAAAIYGYNVTADCEDAKEAAKHPAELPEAAPWLPPPRVAPALQPSACSYDSQCKGNRICEAGRCIAPPPPAVPAPTAPVPDTPVPGGATDAAAPGPSTDALASPPPTNPPAAKAPRSPRSREQSPRPERAPGAPKP